MTKLFIKSVRKALVVLRWTRRPRRELDGINGADTNGVHCEDSLNTSVVEKGVVEIQDDGVDDVGRQDIVVEDEPEATLEQPEVGAINFGGPSEVSNYDEHPLEIEDEGEHEDEIPEDVESRRLNALARRTKRFSIPYVPPPRPPSSNGKGKEKAVVEECNGVVKEESVAEPWRGTSLASIPFDVLHTLMVISEVSTVLSLLQTCRTIHNVAESPTLWIDLSIGLQRRSRILALDDLVHPFTLHSDIPTLKRMILRTDFLERNWRSPKPRIITSSHPHPGQPARYRNRFPVIKTNYDMNTMLFAGSFFISERFWLFSTVHGQLVGLDISAANEEDAEGRIIARNLGIYNMEVPYGLFTFRMHHAERSVYAIVCSPNETPTSFVYNILRIQFPSEDASDAERKLDFSIISTYSVPNDWRIKTQNLDYLRRQICLLYQVSDQPDVDGDRALRLYVLLNWETGAHVEIDTHLYCNKDSGLGLRFADDGESIHIYVMNGTQLVQKSFSLSSLRDVHRRIYPTHRLTTLSLSEGTDPTPAPKNSLSYPLFLVDETVQPIRAFTEELEMPAFFYSPRAELYQYWNLSQWWQRYNLTQHDIHVPTRFSRIFFFYMHPRAPANGFDGPVAAAAATDEAVDNGNGGANVNGNDFIGNNDENNVDDDNASTLSSATSNLPGPPPMTIEEVYDHRKSAWHVLQYYTTSERPLSRKVFAFQLYDCPTINLGVLGFPIMGASFNHLVWIENVSVTETVQEVVVDSYVPPPASSSGVGTGLLSKLPWKKRASTKKEKETEVKKEEQTRTVTRTRTKRVLRLLAFPEPGVSPDSEYDVPDLPQRAPQLRDLDDVPESVLNKAIHMFLEPAMGALLITTSDNEMHRYNYA